MRWEEGYSVSPDEAALSDGAAWGDEAVRPVGFPPGTPAVPPSPDQFGAHWRFRWACRRLDRLAQGLHREGWGTARRYGQSPPVLHVFSRYAPDVGDSVTVVRGPVFWWYRSSAGAWLGPCQESWRAVESMTALLAMWGITPRWSGDDL